MNVAAVVALGAGDQYLQKRRGLHLVRFVLKGRKAFLFHWVALDRVMAEEGLTKTAAALPGGA